MRNFFFPTRQFRLCVHACRLDNTCKCFTDFSALSSDCAPSSAEMHTANEAIELFF